MVVSNDNHGEHENEQLDVVIHDKLTTNLHGLVPYVDAYDDDLEL